MKPVKRLTRIVFWQTIAPVPTKNHNLFGSLWRQLLRLPPVAGERQVYEHGALVRGNA